MNGKKLFVALLFACFQLAAQPVTVYSHGALCNKFVAHVFHTDPHKQNRLCPNAFITGQLHSFNYRDWLVPFLTCWGQENDVERLHAACKEHEQVILVGSSRGAATIINYLGSYKPTNIVAAVVESPYDHVENIVDYWLQTIFVTSVTQTRIKNLLRRIFFNYEQHGLHPMACVAQVAHAIPVLMISSEQDSIIPAWSTQRLHQQLRSAGHPHAYLLACSRGRHGLIAWGADGARMRNVIHAFYRYHGLPHHETWAHEGNLTFLSLKS
jgi:pimeloyl-ACP methyl ester carboxylesterase